MSGKAVHYAAVDIHKGAAPLWPAEIPPMTDDEAIKAARRLWRWAMGETFEGPIYVTSGNRYTWTFWEGNRLALRVNPSKGWREFAHDLSHMFYARANPGEKPHSKAHARFETKLVKQIISRGWLDGKLRPAVKATAIGQATEPMTFERVRFPEPITVLPGQVLEVSKDGSARAVDPLRERREKKLAAALRKLKRAKATVTKLQRQVKYFQKALDG